MATSLTSVAPFKYAQLNEDPDESHEQVLSLIPTGSTVLEVGAALGYMSRAIQARGSKVVAVEKDSRAASVALASGVDVRTGSLEEVSITEQFDCLVLADVLEHVADPDAFLQAGLRHLRQDGFVVLSVPNVAHWSVRWSLLRGRFDYTRTGLLDETHLRFYTARTLEKLLARHGLAVIERRSSVGIGCYPRWRWTELQWRQRQLARILARKFSTLFGYQFIWKAQRRLPGQQVSADDRDV